MKNSDLILLIFAMFFDTGKSCIIIVKWNEKNLKLKSARSNTKIWSKTYPWHIKFSYLLSSIFLQIYSQFHISFYTFIYFVNITKIRIHIKKLYWKKYMYWLHDAASKMNKFEVYYATKLKLILSLYV